MTEEAQAIPTEAPAPPPSEPGPIDANSVVSKPPEEVPAPDSSILADRLDQMLTRKESIDQRRSQEAEFQRLKEEVRILRTMKGNQFDEQYTQTLEKVQGADDNQSAVMKKLQKELETMREGQAQLQKRLEERNQEQELQSAAKDVSAWVQAQDEHFPLINAISQQDLVFQKMWNTKQQTGAIISEAQAAREIEEELRGIVEKAAPILGYQRSEQKAESDQPSQEPISLTTGAFNVAEPVDRDKMTDDEWQDYLIRQYQG